MKNSHRLCTEFLIEFNKHSSLPCSISTLENLFENFFSVVRVIPYGIYGASEFNNPSWIIQNKCRQIFYVWVGVWNLNLSDVIFKCRLKAYGEGVRSKLSNVATQNVSTSMSPPYNVAISKCCHVKRHLLKKS